MSALHPLTQKLVASFNKSKSTKILAEDESASASSADSMRMKVLIDEEGYNTAQAVYMSYISESNFVLMPEFLIKFDRFLADYRAKTQEKGVALVELEEPDEDEEGSSGKKKKKKKKKLVLDADKPSATKEEKPVEKEPDPVEENKPEAVLSSYKIPRILIATA